MHLLFQFLRSGAQRSSLDFRDEDFWGAVRKSNMMPTENQVQNREGKTQAKAKPSPSPQHLDTQQYKKSQGGIEDAASNSNCSFQNEKIKAPLVAAPYGMLANLAISDALLAPPPSFPSLRIGT